MTEKVQNKAVGYCKCPLCRVRCRVAVSEKSGLAYAICSGCHTSIFPRSAIADRLLRDLIDPALGEPAPRVPPAPRTPKPGMEIIAPADLSAGVENKTEQKEEAAPWLY